MKKLFIIVLVLFVFFLGCATSSVVTESQEISLPASTGSQETASENAYKIGPNDVLNISIFAGGEIQYNEDVTVSSQGAIKAPFVGTVKAEGLTPSELEDAITKPLGKDFFVDPKVNVSLKQSKLKIYVGGEINTPNAYDFEPGITALKACIMAGGFTAFAAPNRTKIIRNTKGKIEVIKINLEKVKEGKIPDIELKPGDRIQVPESWL